MKAFLNAAEVAKLLKVNRATVTRWLKKGLVKNAIRPGKGHQWRIPLASYEELTKHHESH
jgi:excisionase family DNA binding protein